MKRTQKVKLIVTIICLSSLSLNCATFANYFLVPLNQRVLRVSRQGPFTEFNWKEEVCSNRVLGICTKWTKLKHTEHDFDFTKQSDRDKFNDMDLSRSDCLVKSK